MNGEESDISATAKKLITQVISISATCFSFQFTATYLD